MTRRAFTYLELVLAMTLLAILAAAAVPATRTLVKRQKEVALRRVLLEVREAIDRFKKMADNGEIEPGSVDQLGYPADFDQLVEGVPLTQAPMQNIRFLRRIPVDPMTGEATWGKRSVQDEPDATSWGGENLFDIYSKSDGIALDGTEYSTW